MLFKSCPVTLECPKRSAKKHTPSPTTWLVGENEMSVKSRSWGTACGAPGHWPPDSAIQAEIEAAQESPQMEGHTATIPQIADLAGVDPEQAAEVLATLEAFDPGSCTALPRPSKRAKSRRLSSWARSRVNNPG
jgi:hypothetical protein